MKVTDEHRAAAGLCLFELDLVGTPVTMKTNGSQPRSYDREEVVAVLGGMAKPVFCKSDPPERTLVVTSNIDESVRKLYEQRLKLLTRGDGIVRIVKRDYPDSVVKILKNGAEYQISSTALEVFVNSYVLGSSISWAVPQWPAPKSPVVIKSGSPQRQQISQQTWKGVH